MKITLVPTAGLCNRMNAILCAIAVQREYNCKVEVYWEKTRDCFADFTDLFKEPKIRNLDIRKLEHFFLKPATKRNLYLPKLLRIGSFDLDLNGNKTTYKEIAPFINGKKNIYITSFNRFCLHEICTGVGSIFIPIDEIENRISSITEQYGKYTIGIHIRRTDNIAAIQNNPIEKFVKAIEMELNKNSEVKFYVASDSESDKKYIIKRFGDRIITGNWDLTRNSVQGMKDATAELYCLGRTSKIIGCTKSTYSLMASWLYDVPLEV